MSSALYRKYRPQTFAQMIGQNHIKITLQHELEKGDIGHAYLFCGPRGLGKTTSARLFAKAVNCQKRKEGESEPCNECSSCLDIMAGRSVDMIEIDAASNTGVENVRENIIENSRFNPVRSKYKVFIIDEVHMLSTHAFNALLKIMEEPPEHVIFTLCTTEIHKLPVTIISRCQRFDFKKVTAEQLLKRLQLVVKGEEKQVEEEVLKRIVAASEGCVRDAESLLSKVLSLGDEITTAQAEIVLPRSDYESISNFVMYLSEKNSAAAIELINRLLEEGMDLAVFNDNLLEFLRQMLLVKSSGQLENYGLELTDNLAGAVSDLANRFSWDDLVSAIEVFEDKGREIKRSAIYQLPLEMAVIKLTQQVTCQKPDEIYFSSPILTVEAKLPANKKSQAPVEAASASAPTPVAPQPIHQVETAATKQASVNLKDIIAGWPKIVQKLIKTNFTLGSLLRMSQPLKCDGRVLEVALSSSFLKGRLEAAANRQAIEQVISDEVNNQVSIKATVSANVVPLEVAVDFGEDKPEEAAEATPQPAVSAFKSPADEVLSMF